MSAAQGASSSAAAAAAAAAAALGASGAAVAAAAGPAAEDNLLVFISFDASNAAASAFVQQLQLGLEAAGVRVATRWGAQGVADRIASSAVFLPVLTESYMNSRRCLQELDCALKGGAYGCGSDPTPWVLPVYLTARSNIAEPTDTELLQLVAPLRPQPKRWQAAAAAGAAAPAAALKGLATSWHLLTSRFTAAPTPDDAVQRQEADSISGSIAVLRGLIHLQISAGDTEWLWQQAVEAVVLHLALHGPVSGWEPTSCSEVFEKVTPLTERRALDIFLDCATVLHSKSIRMALMLWRSWWGKDALPSFRSLMRNQLVSISSDPGSPCCPEFVTVPDISMKSAVKILYRAEGVPAELASYAGSRVWKGFCQGDRQDRAMGLIKDSSPVAMAISPCLADSLEDKEALASVKLDKLRVYMGPALSTEQLKQAPGLIWLDMRACCCDVCNSASAFSSAAGVPSAVRLNELQILRLHKATDMSWASQGQLVMPSFDRILAATLPGLQVLELMGDTEFAYNEPWLPDPLGQRSSLQQLSVGPAFPAIPSHFKALTRLERLELASFTDNRDLMRPLEELPSLTSLSLHSSAVPDLPDIFAALSMLQQIDLHYCIFIQSLPRSFSKLTALQRMDVSKCGSLQVLDVSACTHLSALNIAGCERLLHIKVASKALKNIVMTDASIDPQGTTVPPQLNYHNLKLLDLSGCSSLAQLPDSILSLTGLTNLSLKQCSSLSKTDAWPQEVTRLATLQVLDLSGCTKMAGECLQLPDLRSLRQLSALGIGGWALQQPQLFDLMKHLSLLERLCLAECVTLQALPDSVSKLTKLDLTGCTSLKTLPEGLESREGPRLILPEHLTPAAREAAAREQIIKKLATQQETMLTTLERMSWLVLLLATATFLAFIQPPGGYKDYNVLIGGPAVCRSGVSNATAGNSTAAVNSTAAAPGKEKYVLSGFLSRNGSLIDVQPALERLEGPGQQCALFLFFFFDALSFCLSLGCVMVIVVLSMPRMPCTDIDFEAGRFWLLLLCTWGLLYSAVAAGFVAFVCSAVAVFAGWRTLLGPFMVGAALLFIGLVAMIKRFCEIYPSAKAVRKALPCSGHKKRVRDEEAADPNLSERFWQRLELAVLRGTNEQARQLRQEEWQALLPPPTAPSSSPQSN